jgi:hypothetical protein
MYLCSSEESLYDYEERLLEKCFDKEYEHQTKLHATEYEPPPFAIYNNQQ